ncbi:MAG: VOC family protein [Gammaproteobacteria bacterium]
MAHSMPRITPYLLYEDLPAALEWLSKAFGLRERTRQTAPDGRPVHAEMSLADDGLVLMGWPGPQYRNPKRLGQATQSLYVRVDDVDVLFQRAVELGAVVLEKPADQAYGDRRCGLEDPEGHRWYFAQTLARTG